MRQIVTKFGGTSVSSRETWNHILAITQKHLAAGLQPIIVCSARAQASNQLEKMVEAAILNQHQGLQSQYVEAMLGLAKELEVDSQRIQPDIQQLEQWLTGIALLREAPAKTHAQVLSLGELMMTRLGHAFLTQQGLDCSWFDAREALTAIPMSGDDTQRYCSARVEAEPNPRLAKKLQKSGAVVLTQGFIAANAQGETVLLGRGGSDTSAALLAAILGATVCEIWTDVAGIYTANPHQLPHARLLKTLNYEEAQEIASMGAKVLHPLSIPPVRKANIPMYVKYTCMPDHSGTHIFTKSDDDAPPIKSIQVKHSITLISIDTVSMWQQVGFLADIFAAFKRHEFSVDLLATSESNVTLSLDSHGKPQAHRAKLEALIDELNQFGRARIIEPCSAISLVGHHIRRVLPQLGSAFEVFDDQQVHLISLASNDLNLTFVVDESKAEKLCQQLHVMLIESNPQSFYYSKSWHEEFGKPEPKATPWWETEREGLLRLAKTQSPCYVYDKKTLVKQADALLALQSISTFFYSLKANPHPVILQTLAAKGIGFECVSPQELDLVLQTCPDIDRHHVLFTPNFASKAEYQAALATGCYVTIDSLYPLEHWPEIFAGYPLFLRIDSGTGAGHHKFVCTGGNESKFGIAPNNIERAVDLVKQHKLNIVGLHTHSGSGILAVELWQETATMLIEQIKRFPNVKFINLGGGLGITEKPGQQPLNLLELDQRLQSVKARHPKIELWLEPGRYFVAESGVLLAKVTQCKEKGKVRFVGIETGMNSLIRPMLYGAYHPIVNLSRLNEPNTGFAHIVGPICESGDTLGYDRILPDTFEDDVILIANAGAYGHCMSSSYNLRTAAQELIWPPKATS